MAWTIEDEKKKTFEFINKLVEKTRDTQETIYEVSSKNISMDNGSNIGIQLNNAIVHLSSIFNSVGIEYYRESSLRNIIEHYFNTLTLEGIFFLDKFVEELKKRLELASDISKINQNDIEIICELGI